MVFTGMNEMHGTEQKFHIHFQGTNACSFFNSVLLNEVWLEWNGFGKWLYISSVKFVAFKINQSDRFKFTMNNG